jgi:acetyl esterase/lipase
MSLQRTITSLLLKLPDPILVAMSGGRAKVRDGRKLDARFQFIEAAAAKQPLPNPLTPAFARAGTDLLTSLFGGAIEPDVAFHDATIPATGRDIPARVYRPAIQNPKAPVMVFFHFGGGVVGNVGTCHAFCSMIAKQVQCAVVSVEYRLAPEHQWPAGLDDAVDSFLWVRNHADQFDSPAGLAAAGGDSMGGNFAAILALEMKKRALPQPTLQLLIYPVTDYSDQGGSVQSCADAYPLTKAMMDWFVANYLPPGADLNDVGISPAKATDLSGLAPAIIVTAGHDPLRDQGHAYGQLLRDAGVAAAVTSYDSLAHGFTAYTGAVPAADAACREIVARIASVYRQQGS